MSLASEILFDYQKLAAERIASSRALLLADQPGLGKTLEVLGGIELSGLFDKPANILILCPLVNAQTTWLDTLERFVQPRYDIDIRNIAKGSTAAKSKVLDAPKADKPMVVIANHNSLDLVKGAPRVAGLKAPYWDAVVIDESHLVLPITGAKLTNFWKGLNQLKMPSTCLRVAISGTPDRGKLHNRYGTWRFLHPEIVGSSYWSWLEKNFWLVEQKVSYNRTVKLPQSIRDERLWVITDEHWMLRRTKTEVLTELPPKRYIDVELELPDQQKAKYFGNQLRYRNSLYEKTEDSPPDGSAMVYAIRSRQLATCTWTEEDDKVVPVIGGPSAKLEWLKEWLAERGFMERDEMADNSAKVVIVSQFSKVLHWLKGELDAMGLDARILDGSVSSSDRIEIQKEFQDGELRIVLLSGGMGVGINLDAADDLIMVDSPYDPDRIEQIEDRVHRASNMHSVTIWNLIALGTIDQAIMESVAKRYKVTRELMDGERGVNFERNVVAKLRKETK